MGTLVEGKLGAESVAAGDATTAADCGYQKALHRLRPLDPTRDNPRFLCYVMFSASKRGVFLADGNENTIPHLIGVMLRAHRMGFPPRGEQDAIVQHLDQATGEADRAVERIKLELLREYR